MRLASMDVGTNSTRLLVADATDTRVVAEHARELVITRLGKGVDRTRRFDPGALERTLAVISDYAATCERFGVEAVRVVATSASRDATNAAEFVDGVRRLVGVEPEVLSGAEEAAASFLGATYDLDEQPVRETLVFDIGGGSTELMVGTPRRSGAAAASGTAGAAPEVRSLDVGSVRLTERHIAHDPPTRDEVEAVRASAEAAISEIAPLFAPRVAVRPRSGRARLRDDQADSAAPSLRAGRSGGAVQPPGQAGLPRDQRPPSLQAWSKDLHVVGVAGTVTTVTAISLGLERYDRGRVHRATLTPAQVRATADRLCAMTVAEKAAIPVMPPGREDVIAAGALILDTVCQVLGLTEFQVSETDILDGVLLGLAERLGA